MRLSVIIPTHNPDPVRLARTLAGLSAQTLPRSDWELVLIDNGSSPPLGLAPDQWPELPATRLLTEPRLGLTHARHAGFAASGGDYVVMVDDDNVLAPDYLAHAVAILDRHPRLGAIGGRSRPEFERPPAPWTAEFHGLLACRDLGPDAIIAEAWWNASLGRNDYPACSPIGAGMALRAAALHGWRQADDQSVTDRRGSALTSGGDNDLIMTMLTEGWGVGYFPELSLTHLIPASRTTRAYLARLNEGIAQSWVQVLAKHRACPWQPIPRWTVGLRQAKAWLVGRAWTGPAAYVRWRGACGHFAGLATLRPFHR